MNIVEEIMEQVERESLWLKAKKNGYSKNQYQETVEYVEFLHPRVERLAEVFEELLTVMNKMELEIMIKQMLLKYR